MNDQLQELLESVQKTASQMSGAAVRAVDKVGKKTTALLSVGKLNIKAMELKGEINEKLREIGGMLYATHTGELTDSEDLFEKLEEIDGLQADLRSIETEIARLQQGSVCPICGSPAKSGDTFCRECGGKLS